jgi:hypothetical protein
MSFIATEAMQVSFQIRFGDRLTMKPPEEVTLFSIMKKEFFAKVESMRKDHYLHTLPSELVEEEKKVTRAQINASLHFLKQNMLNVHERTNDAKMKELKERQKTYEDRLVTAQEKRSHLEDEKYKKMVFLKNRHEISRTVKLRERDLKLKREAETFFARSWCKILLGFIYIRSAWEILIVNLHIRSSLTDSRKPGREMPS